MKIFHNVFTFALSYLNRTIDLQKKKLNDCL